MAQVFVSIGSNIDREHSVRFGVRELARRYGALTLSPVYETEAVGFDGDNFYNLVAAFETSDSPRALTDILHDIEAACGRERNGPRFSSRTLDIDLLLYDDQDLNAEGLNIPRDEITRYAFVLKPLADIAPDLTHPVLKQSYAELWQTMQGEADGLWPIAFSFEDDR